MNLRIGLAACGAAIAVLAAAGCGPGASSGASSGTTGGGTAPPPSATASTLAGGASAPVSPSATTAASAAMATGASGYPPWTREFGPGVTVKYHADTGDKSTPAYAVLAFEYYLISGDNPAKSCPYVIPSLQASCRSAFSHSGGKLGRAFSADTFDVTYGVTDGDHALVGSIYSQLCVAVLVRHCVQDVTDMDAAFDSGKPFAVLWAQALHGTGTALTSFTPIPCVKINGTWYIDELATCGYIC